MKVTDQRLAEIRAAQEAKKEQRRQATRREAFALIHSAPTLDEFREPEEYDPMADPMYDRDFHL